MCVASVSMCVRVCVCLSVHAVCVCISCVVSVCAGANLCRSTYFEHQMLVESSSKADSSLQAKQQLLAEGMYHMIDVH